MLYWDSWERCSSPSPHTNTQSVCSPHEGSGGGDCIISGGSDESSTPSSPLPPLPQFPPHSPGGPLHGVSTLHIPPGGTPLHDKRNTPPPTPPIKIKASGILKVFSPNLNLYYKIEKYFKS